MKYTEKDSLNAISWQLKRIADCLEKIVNQPQHTVTSNQTPSGNTNTAKLKEFLDKLGE